MQSTGVTLGDPDESLALSVPPQAFGCPPCCSSLAESRAATVPPLCRGVGEEEQWMLLPSPAAKVAGAGGRQLTHSPGMIHLRRLAGAAGEPERLQPGQDVLPRGSPSPWPPALG